MEVQEEEEEKEKEEAEKEKDGEAIPQKKEQNHKGQDYNFQSEEC